MDDRELTVRRAELEALAQAGRDAEAALRALAEIDKADDELQSDPLMIATRKAIEQYNLTEADAARLLRAQRMTIVMATMRPWRP